MSGVDDVPTGGLETPAPPLPPQPAGTGGASLGVSIVPTDMGADPERPEIAPPADAKAPDPQLSRTEPFAEPAPTEAPKGTTRIGLYEVLREIGRGGMGAVYEAWHPMRRKKVALKVIKPDLAETGKYQRLRELFLREAGILMSVRHENVVGCYDANEADHEGKPALYMALELLEGESLSERLAKGPLELAEAVRVATCLAKALQALHTNQQRILHRDLKPANVYLMRDGGVKLLDFGLAGVADWRLQQISMFAAGSRPYMSPEQFDGLRFCTERSDLYSLGVTLFQMVAGRCPFESDTDQGYLNFHKRVSPPALVERKPDLAPSKLLDAVQNIVTKLLAKRPDERYPSAAEVVEALERAAGGGVIAKPKVTRPEVQRLKRLIGTAAAAVVLATGLTWGALKMRESSIPGQVAQARQLVTERRLAEAQRIAQDVLKVDKDNPDAQAVDREV
ncbi:MAG TPA: serine/threonine-protein kinase, partial [Planctomycetota bacterium]|nr:serine/threonine-protein kinase [Planctomycetota bacterium]